MNLMGLFRSPQNELEKGGKPVPEEDGTLKRDRDGKLVTTRLNEVNLRRLAAETGGIYVRSTVTDTGLAAIENRIKRLDQAEQELGYTWVRSPISGHISERHVDLGTLVGTSGKSLLATIVKSDTVLVDFSMTALDYLKSKERNVVIGQKDSSRSWQPTVTITLPDNSTYIYKGIVDFAEPQVNPKTGTFSVRAEMPNPDRVLLPGQFTKVRVLLDVREHATVVPQKALMIEKGGAHVFVMRRDSTVERRFIELGPEFGNNVVVERGIVPGENIVTEGYHKLTPGIMVSLGQPIEDEESVSDMKSVRIAIKSLKSDTYPAYESEFLY